MASSVSCFKLSFGGKEKERKEKERKEQKERKKKEKQPFLPFFFSFTYFVLLFRFLTFSFFLSLFFGFFLSRTKCGAIVERKKAKFLFLPSFLPSFPPPPFFSPPSHIYNGQSVWEEGS